MQGFFYTMVIASLLFAQEPRNSRSFLVKVEPVKSGTMREYIYAYGRVTGLEEAAVVPTMPGRVVSILKNEGERVQKDEIIALLDREIPGVKTEYLQIVSPINGIITYINGKVGQIATQTQPFAYIVSEQQAVEVNLSSDDLQKVRVGANAFAIDGGKEIEGSVVSRSYGLDPMSLTGKVRISLRRNVLQVGSIVNVKIVTKEKSGVLIVPENAIAEKGDRTVVYVVKDEVAKEVPVEVGIISEGWAEVKGNLNVKDLVVTLGAEGLYDGAPVELGGK